MAGNGSCTWTYDGDFWTCVDNCADGKECVDILEMPAGTFTSKDLATKNDPVASSFFSKIKKHKHPGTGKVTFGIPMGLFRRSLELHPRVTHPDLTNPAVMATMSSATTAAPIKVTIECR